MSFFSGLRAGLDPLPEIDDAGRERSMLWVRRNGVGSQTMETLTIGVFLTAYALELGASNFVIGVIAAMPHAAQFAQLPGVFLVEKFRKRKAVAVIAGALSRPMLLLLTAAAFVPSQPVALTMIALALMLRYGLGAIVATGWNGWMRDLIPEGMMGAFFGTRLRLMAIVGTVISLAAAVFIDLVKFHTDFPIRYAYGLLFVGGFFGGVYSVYCMYRIEEPRLPKRSIQPSFWNELRRPFRDLNFRRLLLFLGSWNFAINLAAPFFTVHMLVRLQLDVSTITILTTISQICNILVVRRWGLIADRVSNKTVLKFCAPIFIACIFGWTFTTFPDRHILTLPLLLVIHIVTGIATAGVTLASSNIALKLAPKGEATAYLAANSLTNAICSGVAPLIGGLLADFFVNRQLSVLVRWTAPGEGIEFQTLSFSQWDFFFLFATVVGFYSIYRLNFVEEEGSVKESISMTEVLFSTKRGPRTLSSISGLKGMSEFPLDLLTAVRRRRGSARKAPDGIQDPKDE